MKNVPETINKLIAVYGRVSTSNQEKEETIEAQLLAVREFAHKHGYHIVNEYIDEGWSGDNIVRPALDQLRMDAKNKLWEAILIYDPDRLARRSAWQEVVIEELSQLGISVLFVTIPPPKSDEDVIMYKMRGVFAEYERMKIKERFRLGKLRKVQEGHVLTTEAPYGYRYIPIKKVPGQPKEHGYYVIHPEEAKVVKMIFSWIADEKYNIRKVVRRLQELGIKPQRSSRGVWSTSTLTTMLRNKAYIGEAHFGKTIAVVPEKPLIKDKYRKNKKSSRKDRPEEEWAASKIPVPPIISRELFERMQTQLRTNAQLSPRHKKYQYLLSGKIRCVCGKSRSGFAERLGKHLYYRCNDKIYCFPLPPRCKERSINARIADELVWQRIAELTTSPKLLMEQVRRWSAEQPAKAQSALGEMDALKKELIKLREKEDRFNKAYGEGVLTLEQLREYITPLRNRAAAIRSQIEAAQRAEQSADVTRILPRMEDITAFTRGTAKALRNLSFEAKRVIITDVIDNIIGTQEKLDVHGHISLSPAYISLCAENRNSRDAMRYNPQASEVPIVPFAFTIPLPPPRYARIIATRDRRGRIVRSMPAAA